MVFDNNIPIHNLFEAKKYAGESDSLLSLMGGCFTINMGTDKSWNSEEHGLPDYIAI